MQNLIIASTQPCCIDNQIDQCSAPKMVSSSSPLLTPEQLAALQREDGGPLLISIVSVFTAIGCILVCLRIYARLIIIRNIGLEDYCIMVSFVRLCTWQLNYISLTYSGACYCHGCIANRRYNPISSSSCSVY